MIQFGAYLPFVARINSNPDPIEAIDAAFLTATLPFDRKKYSIESNEQGNYIHGRVLTPSNEVTEDDLALMYYLQARVNQPSIKFLQPLDLSDEGRQAYSAHKEAFFKGDVAANFNALC